MTEKELLKQLEQEITKEYKDTESVIKGKIDDFTKGFDKNNKLYLEKVKNGEIDEKTYKQWYKQQVTSQKWCNDMIKELSEDMTKANVKASEIINGYTSDLYLNGCLEASGEFEDLLGFDLIDRKQINSLIKENESLLPKSKVSVPKDEKWNERRMRSAVLQSALKGESIPKLSKRLEHIVGMNHTSSVRNARTMMTSSHNLGKLNMAEEAINMGINVKKMWIATNDDRTRESHAEMDGVTVDVDEPFVLTNMDGSISELMYPADPDGDPEQVYNCRCTMGYVIDEEYDNQEEDIFSVGFEDTDTESSDEEISHDIENRRTFEDINEAENWIYNPKNSNAGIWEDELDSIEHGIAYEYTDTAFRPINNYLRGIWDEEYAEERLNGYTEGLSFDYITKKLDSAIDKSVIHEPFTAKRCMGIEMLDRFEVGESFIDLGYGSSTIDPNLNFMGNPVRMDIAIPSGKGIGAYVNGLSYYEDIEYEFLIARGGEYKTIEKEKRIDDYGEPYWYILAELVGVGRNG